MPFDVNPTPEERFWILTTVGAVVAWFGRDFVPKLFGGRKSELRMLREENEHLRASLSQMLAAFEVSMVAMQLPLETRQPYIDRALRIAEESKTILNIGRAPEPEQLT